MRAILEIKVAESAEAGHRYTLSSRQMFADISKSPVSYQMQISQNLPSDSLERRCAPALSS